MVDWVDFQGITWALRGSKIWAIGVTSFMNAPQATESFKNPTFGIKLQCLLGISTRINWTDIT